MVCGLWILPGASLSPEFSAHCWYNTLSLSPLDICQYTNVFLTEIIMADRDNILIYSTILDQGMHITLAELSL